MATARGRRGGRDRRRRRGAAHGTVRARARGLAATRERELTVEHLGHPAAVERRLLVAWDGRGCLLAAVAHHFPTLGVADATVAVACDGRVSSLTTGARLPGRGSAIGSVPGPVRWGAERLLVGDHFGDGTVSGQALDLQIRPVGDPVPDEGTWSLPGPGLRRTSGTVRPVDVTVDVGHLVHWATGVPDPGPRPRELAGIARNEHGLAHLPRLAALGPPATDAPRCWAARLVVRRDDAVQAWSVDAPADLAVELEPGTRRPSAVRTPDGTHLRVASVVPMRALGPSDGWWTPGTWHDDPVVGRRRRDLGSAAGTDVAGLHTLALLTGADGATGVLEHLALGPHPEHGLAGFVDGAPAGGAAGGGR